jgi:cytochrome P450
MKPPRHADHFLMGSLRDIQRDPLGFLTSLHRKYGDVSVHRIGPLDYYLVVHPDGIKRILQDNHPNYTKRVPDVQTVGYLTGPGVLVTDGSDWMRRRRLMQPAFHRDRIQQMMQTMGRLADEWVSGMPTGRAVNANQMITLLTVRIATNTLFSLDLDLRAGDVMEGFTQLNELLIRRFRAGRLFRPIPLFSDDRKFLKTLRRFDGIIDGIIAARRAEPGESFDLLSMLMSARDEEDGGFLSDEDLRSEIKTLLLAGFETTSNALGWSVFELGRRPELQEELAGEVRGQESLEGMVKLPRLRAFFEEILRVYPPAWYTARRAEKADVLCGFDVPAGARVVVSPYLLHRHPEFWEEPERFDPERFLPGKREGAHRFSYFPFGGGPRQCIGNQFAMAEAMIILAKLLRAYRVSLPRTTEPGAMPLITLRMKEDIDMVLERRANPA